MEILKYFLGVSFILAGILHFIKPRFYLKIMPSYLPFPMQLIYLSGLTEIVAGCLLIYSKTQEVGAFLIILQLIAFLIIHFNMLFNANSSLGIKKSLLWIRLIVQFLLIYWVTFYLK